MPKFNNLKDFKHKKTVFIKRRPSDLVKYKLLITMAFKT